MEHYRTASLCVLILLLSFADDVAATDLARPDAHAPIGVMGDHIHGSGEWMFSYRYMRMEMQGNLDGTNHVDTTEILNPPNGPFLVAPREMDMEMHMLGAMYAPHDRVTLMVMFPVVVLDMSHVTAMGGRFSTQSAGIGDIRTTALVGLFDTPHHQLHLNAGLSFPSGSIDRKDETPASGGVDVILPYPMQLGSGTLDLLPGLTYNGQFDSVSWGFQALGTIRMGRNDENYRLGHRYDLTAWGAVRVTRWLSVSTRAAWHQIMNIAGRDDRLSAPPGVSPEDFVPTADPTRRAGRRLDLGPGVNFYVPSSALKGIRIGVEAMFPVYQSLDGPQLETDWTMTAGIQYAF